MKILYVYMTNFGSYPLLEVDLEGVGLALVSGPTGAGKSTVLDAIAWTLFGQTSKEGAADDVCAWGSEESTTGYVVVETANGSQVAISRIRGKTNDLCWNEVESSYLCSKVRGKDLVDTQRLLEERLGCTAELFLLGSYLTQFSKADTFFIANAKQRRETLEKVADQEFAIKLAERCSEARKASKKEADALEIQASNVRGKVQTLGASVDSLSHGAAEWEAKHAEKISVLEAKFETFDYDKVIHLEKLYARMHEGSSALEDTHTRKELETRLFAYSGVKEAHAAMNDLIISSRTRRQQLKAEHKALLAAKDCPTCKRPLERGDSSDRINEIALELDSITPALRALEERVQSLSSDISAEGELRAKILQLDNKRALDVQNINNFKEQVILAKTAPNPYGDQIKYARSEQNPFLDPLSAAITDLHRAKELQDVLLTQITDKNALTASLTWLYDKSFELRAINLQRVVQQLESATNAALERFFDAALRITLSLEDSDKLQIMIYNNGNLCPFKSLSGGERCMLKLAFSISLMRAAQDRAGIKFGQLFLDEPMTGLDDGLKVKAFGLLEQLALEYPTVLVIEHSSELKSQFNKVFTVDKSKGYSELHEQ